MTNPDQTNDVVPVPNPPTRDEACEQSPRAIVFIDGNNWYHSLADVFLDGIRVRASALDYGKVATKLAMGRKVCGIRYYVGEVTGDLRRVREQQGFLSRLAEQGVEVFLGRIQRNPMDEQEKSRRRGLLGAFVSREDEIPGDLMRDLRNFCLSDTPRYVEKQVDTKICVDLVDLAYRDEYEAAYLISADADFVPAVEMVRRMGRTVFAVSPLGGYELKQAVDRYIKVPADWFEGLFL